MPWVGLQCVIVVFPVHTHFLKAGFQVALTADIPFFYCDSTDACKGSKDCLSKSSNRTIICLL